MSVIADSIARLRIGSPLQHQNLTLYPLLRDDSGPTAFEADYRLLDEALAEGSARVTEVSESGSVPELRVINDGAKPVLLLDGEELIGAKQNRILNLTVLAPAQQTILIPVSCVEQGRWHAQSETFGSAQRAHFAAGRARKAADVSDSLRRRGTRESDQSAVWQDIAERSRRFGVTSQTGAAADLYTQQRTQLDAFQQAFQAQPTQCGALFAINGRLVGLDLFDCPGTLAAALGKLVESHALDALDAANAPMAPQPPAPQPWLERIATAEIERFAAVGEGEDWRLSGAGLAGGALVKDDRLVHLCAFRLGEVDPQEPSAEGDLAPPETLTLELDSDRRLIRRHGHSQRYLHLRLRAPRGLGTRIPVDLALVVVSDPDPQTTAKIPNHSSTGEMKIGWNRAVEV
ncbi:MAG: hypothetical protein K9L32_05770 [Chromatiaceae bacterium]|nr:hypothetical protein [Chromatiaceae bacterium]